MSNSLRPHRLYSPWNSPDQNTEVGSHTLLQGIFPTQGSNPGLLHCRQILYHGGTREAPKVTILFYIFVSNVNNVESYEGLWTFLVAQIVKNLPAMQETKFRALCQEDPLEEGMATHSSILAWRIPWTVEPGGATVHGVIQSWT